jgi:putative oxidoreductase
MTIGLLVLRLVLGLTIAAHGSQKLFSWFGGKGLSATAAAFENHLGLRPGRTHALLAGVTEFGGGMAMALGFLTPLAAMAIVGVMVVAGWTGHRAKGFFITDGGFEYTLVLGGMAAGLAFTGPGRISVDHLLGLHLDGALWGTLAVVLGCVAGAGMLAERRRQEAHETAPEDRVAQKGAAQVAGGRQGAMAAGGTDRLTDAQRPGR